jgi:hypothetical protein
MNKYEQHIQDAFYIVIAMAGFALIVLIGIACSMKWR